MPGRTEKFIYERNVARFRIAYPYEYQKYTEWNSKKAKFSIEEVETYTKKTAIKAVFPDERQYMLQSIYGEDDYINDAVDSLGKLGNRCPIFIVGLPAIEEARKIIKKCHEECIVLIYEPSIEVLDYYLKNVDITDLFGILPVSLYFEGLSGDKLLDRVASLFTLETISLFRQFVSPNYENICGEEVLKASRILKEAFHKVMSMWLTAARFTDVAGNNMLYNLRSLIDGYNVSELFGMLKNEIPVILVSAGPSLNKNIDDLKKAKGKAFIIAVDTAIKPLLNHGIKPDLFCIVDGKKPTALMDHPGIHEIPLVTSLVVASGIMDLHKGKKFFYACDELIEKEIFDRCRKETGCKKNLYPAHIPTGGSVANSAFSLAHYMGAKEIILVGQDLALTGGKTHADGTFKDKMKKITAEEAAGTFYVDGIHGNKVLTRDDFDVYRRWFEAYIEDEKLKNVIDATQGGAKIKGTKIMALKAAIEKYCTKKCDIQGKIDALPKMLDYSAKRALIDVYESLPEKMSEVRKMAHKGVSLYKKFGKLASAENPDEKELKKCAAKLKTVNDFMNDDNFALFVQSNMVNIDYIMRMSIYEEDEDEVEERIKIARHGQSFNSIIELYAAHLYFNTKEIVKKRKLKATKADIGGPLDKFLYELSKEA
ncbi:MAG: motility associated factor glycosyltransferase family protein [Lachnospiraceae bacterium]|nr:motility associated factor glycosyltransferase family protein [Lachnospiraceae bacterium]